MNNNFKGTIHKSFVGKLEKWILENYKVGDAISVKDVKNNYYTEYEDIPHLKELNQLTRDAYSYKEKKPYLKELQKIRSRHKSHTEIIMRDFQQLFLKGMTKWIHSPGFEVLKGFIPGEESFKEVEKRYIKQWNRREELAKSPDWLGGPYPNGYRGTYPGEILLVTKTTQKMYNVKFYPLNSLMYCGTGLCIHLNPEKIRLVSKQSPVLEEKGRLWGKERGRFWSEDKENLQLFFVVVDIKRKKSQTENNANFAIRKERSNNIVKYEDVLEKWMKNEI